MRERASEREREREKLGNIESPITLAIITVSEERAGALFDLPMWRGNGLVAGSWEIRASKSIAELFVRFSFFALKMGDLLELFN